MGSPGEFGYPERKWDQFTGGDMLIAALGEREVRDRLQTQHPTALQNGGAAECAERLLLLELGIQSAEALLFSCHGQEEVIVRRLAAAGLRQDGNPLQCAARLLQVLEAEVPAFGHEYVSIESDDDNEDLPPLIPLDLDNDVSIVPDT